MYMMDHVNCPKINRLYSEIFLTLILTKADLILNEFTVSLTEDKVDLYYPLLHSHTPLNHTPASSFPHL